MLVLTWIATGLVAVIHVLSGSKILARPEGKAPPNVERAIGIVEILGGIGVGLPALIGIAEWLIPIAAFGLVAVHLLAAIFHLQRRDYRMVPINIAVGAIAAFVGAAWQLWA
jgi:DoxX-like family